MRAPQHHNFWRDLLAVCVICLVSACASSINDSSQTSPVDIAQGIKANQFALQATVMSMADDLNTELSEAVYLIQATPGIDMRTRWYAQGILCDGMGASLDIAAGPNPGVAMLDLLVLSSLQAWVAEKNWVANGFPKESAPRVIESFQIVVEILAISQCKTAGNTASIDRRMDCGKSKPTHRSFCARFKFCKRPQCAHS